MKKIFEIDFLIYSEEDVKQAVWDFSDVWEITLNKSILEISWENNVEIEEIFNELMNYVLSL